MHLKCEDFLEKYPNLLIHSCPCGNGAYLWRMKFHIADLVQNTFKATCTCGKPQEITVLRNHLQTEEDQYGLKKATWQYLQYCEEHLPQHADHITLENKKVY